MASDKVHITDRHLQIRSLNGQSITRKFEPASVQVAAVALCIAHSHGREYVNFTIDSDCKARKL